LCIPRDRFLVLVSVGFAENYRASRDVLVSVLVLVPVLVLVLVLVLGLYRMQVSLHAPKRDTLFSSHIAPLLWYL
jgi:hypothetical protein